MRLRIISRVGFSEEGYRLIFMSAFITFMYMGLNTPQINWFIPAAVFALLFLKI